MHRVTPLRLDQVLISVLYPTDLHRLLLVPVFLAW